MYSIGLYVIVKLFVSDHIIQVYRYLYLMCPFSGRRQVYSHVRMPYGHYEHSQSFTCTSYYNRVEVIESGGLSILFSRVIY